MSRWLMLLLGLGLHAGAQAATVCGTPAFFDTFVQATPKPLPPRPPSPFKGIRDAQSGVCSGQEVSENFVLKWGGDSPPATDEIDQIMEALETSWQHELNVMNHAHPYGTDDYLFNVYVGDSGGCTPSAYGMGGYYTTDEEGWPFIVLSQGVFDNPDFGQTTVAHEFYHAVQHAEGAFISGEDVQWWWEATAMWVEGQVYPATEDYYVFLYGYAFEPHHQLNAYQYPGAWVLEEYHQYGAAIWPRYITEFVSTWETIRDTWTDGDEYDDPVDLVAEMLDEDIEEVFADFAAHNATWDYLHGENIASYLDYISETQSHGSRDRRITDYVSSSGTGERWSVPPVDTLPQRFGYNTIRMNRPEKGEVIVRFEGESTGSSGSTSSWRLRVVRELPSRAEYTAVSLDDGVGEAEISIDGTEEALYLVATVVSPAWNEGETFNYRYQLDAGETSGGGGGGDGGGAVAGGAGAASTGGGAYQPYSKKQGCSSVQPVRRASAGLLGFLALLGLLSRRRVQGGVR
jgi:hypothetical protein